MRSVSTLIIFILSTFFAKAQHNHVFSGGEMFNFGIVDLSINQSINWSTDRTSKPGYFSVKDDGYFANYSDRININGYVKKYGNTRFKFPIGNGKYLRTVEIWNLKESTDAYAVAWIDGDPSDSLDPTAPYAGKHPVHQVSGAIKEVSKIGQWDWQVGEMQQLGTGTTGNGDGVKIRVSIPDMKAFAQAEELRIVGWNGFQWIDLSRSATASGNTENSKIDATIIPGITALAIGKIKSNPAEIRKTFYLYPNPVSFNQIINIRFTVSSEGNGYIIVIDAQGKQVLRKSIQYNIGTNQFTIDAHHLSSGSYYVNVIGSNDENLFTGQKFIKR